MSMDVKTLLCLEICMCVENELVRRLFGDGNVNKSGGS